MKKCSVLFSVLILFTVVLSFPALAQQQQPDVYDYEWYLHLAPNEEGKAYLAFWCDNAPIQLQHNPAKDSMPYYWDICYSYEETNGVDFHVERVTEVFFNEENEICDVFVSEGQACEFFVRGSVISAGMTGGTNIIRPASSDTGFGIAVSGTDANGNERTFGFYVPLSQEIQKNYVLADVTAENIPEEGKAFMQLCPSENPAPLLVASDAFGGGNGWFYGFTMENQSEISFTPAELIELFFVGEQCTSRFVYPAETMVNDWGYPAEYRQGESASFGGGMPEQSVTGVGYLLRGVDENGNELEFTTYVELERK